MKTKKTGPVNTDSARWAYGLTPCFSPGPSVLDLFDGERIVKWMRGERHLVGERQKIIIIIEDLRGYRIVLCSGVTGKALA